MKINNERINQFALQSTKGNVQAFNNLFEELQQFLGAEVRKATRKAASKNVFIPSEDFESAFNQAVWQAAQNFDGSSQFIQRLRFFMSKRESDVWRSNSSQVDGERNYEKARTKSLDEPINDEGDTLGDAVLAKAATPSPEDIIVGHNHILEAIESFAGINAKYQKVIKMLAEGAEMGEIAEAFGEVTYNGKMRIMVKRARTSFEKHLEDTCAID